MAWLKLKKKKYIYIYILKIPVESNTKTSVCSWLYARQACIKTQVRSVAEIQQTSTQIFTPSCPHALALYSLWLLLLIVQVISYKFLFCEAFPDHCNWKLCFLWIAMLFYLKLFFYWSIIGWQYCIGFWCTMTCISHMYTCFPSLLSLPSSHHPTPLGHTDHQAKLPVLYRASHWLSISHMVVYIYISMLLSFYASPLSLLCLQVHSLCLCFYCCSANRFISTIFLDSIYIH